MATASVTCSITISSAPPATPGTPNLYLALIGVASVTGTALSLAGALTGGIPLNSPNFAFLGAPVMIVGAGPGGAPLWTTIAAITDGLHATLADAVLQNVVGVEVDCYFPVIENLSAPTFQYYVREGTYDFNSSLSTRPTLDFEIFSKPVSPSTQAYIPQVGMPVLLILDGVGDVFGGSIDQVQAENVPGQLPVTSKCQCVSWDQVLTKRLLMLTGAFSAGTTKDGFLGDGINTTFGLSRPPVQIVSVKLSGVEQSFGFSGDVYLTWALGKPAVVTSSPVPNSAALTIEYYAADATVQPPQYIGLPAEQIFYQLLQTIAASEGLTAVAVPGPIVDQIQFTTQDTIDSALTSLLSYINDGSSDYRVWVDARKQVHFDIQGVTEVAPWSISVADASDANVLIQISLTTTREKFANASWADIAAARGLTTLRQSWQGDGSTRDFQTRYGIAAVVSLTKFFNNGTSYPQEAVLTGQTPPGLVVDAWYYDLNQTSLSEDPSGPTMPVEASLVLVYYPSFSITETFFDKASIAARQAVEGGSGEYDIYANLSSTNPVLRTAPVAQNLATYYARMSQKLDVVTYRGGLATGQGITVDLPQIGAVGQFIVDSVKLTDENNLWKWTVSLSAGAIVGDWKDAMVRLANLL